MKLITPVILCGGSGTRLWPLSRKPKPKPFLPLVGDASLFEATLARAAAPDQFTAPVVVAGGAHIELIEGQLPPGAAAQLIVEPEGKNTAAAIALAAERLPRDAVMLVCPSDHHIADTAAFADAAARAAALAREGWLVSFGIAPTRPETGYGYLKQGPALAEGFRIERFVEKPDRATAEGWLAEGGYWWNGGIFAFEVGTFLDELARHRPAMAEAVRASVASGSEDGARFYPGAEAFAAITGESVDYAVMEGTDRAAMVPVDMGWSDIGNWEALRDARAEESSAADGAGNVVKGTGELLDCRNVMIETDGPRVSVVGLDDVIVVVNGMEVLVTSARGAAQVGKLGGATNQ
ncbi:MAG: sugar phosphate nucleotidyltransferase [Candidatus Andeanibacterium colombiense]|uniref:Sugar phosphate nucleotidyltransferase n=1 Tax=Candidatus Andeanibacterium colombiense TaxID=3121345 RepID=A0AAJ6BM97_9SPHN|nr:MAG: sugar phosphate nucleotidyltransferase [Sphingomonadaceae bacterium]